MQPLFFFPCLWFVFSGITWMVCKHNVKWGPWHLRTSHDSPKNTDHIRLPLPIDEKGEDVDFSIHPIDDLIAQANQDHQRLLLEQTTNVSAATAAYRKRRGRHPPPYFDAWLSHAAGKDAVMIESLFDQIYEDLEPFWAIPPATIRMQAASWPARLSIRYGGVELLSKLTDRANEPLLRWQALLQNIPYEYLPDVDMPMNPDVNPHIFVPHE